MVERITENVDYMMELRGLGSPDRCAVVALIKSIIAEYRGERLTIPAEDEGAETRTKVRAEFTGTNHQELAERYGKHLTTIYRYVK